VASFTPQPLHSQGKSPWYPLDSRLGGPQSRSGNGGDEKNVIQTKRKRNKQIYKQREGSEKEMEDSNRETDKESGRK
jgi:hypothetical protein